VVPVIHDADRKSVHDIAREAAELTQAARERRLRPDQLAGLTFTVNNYGSLGIWLGTPIIPPGTVCNLGIGRVEDTPVARDGEVVIRPILPIACSGDHRLLDGDTLAAFVSDVARLVEEPGLLLGELR
jgi:pyruvate dehydrogenase E2 component (dihydrolipoamide acetyltransferase)